MSTDRRPPFRTQTLGGILLRMLIGLASPRRRAAARTAPSTAAISRGVTGPSAPLVISLAALLVVVVVSAVVLVRVFTLSASPNAGPGDNSKLTGLVTSLGVTPIAQPTSGGAVVAFPTAVPLVVPAGVQAILKRSFNSGGGTAFAQPQDALRGPDGRTYVADTGHGRVAVLDATGKLILSISAGPGASLKSPFGLALAKTGDLLVLDSELGRVIEYGPAGDVVRSSGASLPLVHARGISVDRQGDVLVAAPALDAIITLGPDLALLRQQPNVGPGGAHLFDQPSSVAAGPGGSVFVVDSQNNRLVRFDAQWKTLQSWPLSAGDTFHAPHILPLADGRVLVSYPAGNKLLLFGADGGQPRSYSLPAEGGQSPLPVGLAAVKLPEVLVACTGGGVILDISLPSL